MASAASKGNGILRKILEPFFNAAIKGLSYIVPKSVLPKVTPLIEASASAGQYTPEALGLHYGLLLIPPFITFCIILYSCVQFVGFNFFGRAFQNCLRTFQNISNPKRKDSKQNRVFKILWRIAHWPVYIAIALIRLCVSVINIETLVFFIVFFFLTYFGLQLEENQNDLIVAADDTLSIGRGLYNFAGGVLNALWDILYALLVPTYNVVVEFTYSIGAITFKYMSPIFQGKPLPKDFSGRQLEDAAIPFVGEGFKLAMRVIGTIHEALLSIFLQFIVYIYDLLMYFFFGIGEGFVQSMIRLVSGFHCYADGRFGSCTILQILQAMSSGIALLINIFIEMILSLGIPGLDIPKVGKDIFHVQCSEARSSNGQPVGPEDCSRCKNAFPGWESDCQKIESRRLLVSCDELPNEHWQEIVYWQGDILDITGMPKNSSNFEACPITRDLIFRNDYTIYQRYYGHQMMECITVQINMKTVIKCPMTDPERFPEYMMQGEGATQRRRRNLLDFADGPPKNLADEFKKENDQKKTKSEKITREAFTKQYKIENQKVNKQDNTVFDCSAHENTSHLFDVICGAQTLSMREELFPAVKMKATAATTSFYNQKNLVSHGGGRLLFNHEPDSFQKHNKANELISKISRSIYDFQNHDHEAERRRLFEQAEVKLINKTQGTNSCLPGYVPCKGTNYCELPSSCVCPRPTRAFTSFSEEILYNLYVASCESGDLVVSVFKEIGKCWVDYKKDDTVSPFSKIAGIAENAIQQKQKVYCIPLIGPDSFRFQKWEDWSLQTHLIKTYCNETTVGNTISSCVCPGYDNGITAYNAEWKQGLGYYLWARLKNTIKIVRTWVLGVLNTGGYANYIHSGFWGSFGFWPKEWVYLFDVNLSQHELWCTFFHIGSFCAVFGWFVMFCKLVYAFLPSLWIMFDDTVFSIVLSFMSHYEEALLEHQRINQEALNEIMTAIPVPPPAPPPPPPPPPPSSEPQPESDIEGQQQWKKKM